MWTKTCAIFWTSILLILMGFVISASAEVVGRLTLVEGGVDFLKAGKLPAVPAKQDDGVEVGDVLRTRSLSKAQVTFIDQSVVTVSPESRLAIEAYLFDPAKKERHAVLELFRGMALAVVSKIFVEHGDNFVVKTHTAIMGVRGTEVGIRLGPNDTTFLNFQGLTQVANIFPELSGDLFKKAARVAYSFGPGSVDLKDMQGTVVSRGLPPTLPFTITGQDRQMFMRQLGGEFRQSSVGNTTNVNSAVADDPSGSNVPSSQSFLNLMNTFLTQPTITPNLKAVMPPTPVASVTPVSPATFTFSENIFGPISVLQGTGPASWIFGGSGVRTGAYPGNFSLNFHWAAGPAGANTASITLSSVTGTVTGLPGQALTGTLTISNAITSAGAILNLAGPVKISPNGNLISYLTGTIATNSQTGYAKATLTQTIAPTVSAVARTPQK